MLPFLTLFKSNTHGIFKCHLTSPWQSKPVANESNAGEIKIPTYLRDLIPYFWGWPKDYKIDKVNSEKYQNCILKIVDTQNPNDVLTDKDAKLFQREGENNFNIYSKVLNDMNINENDILRFIKTQSADGYYFCCEIVRQEAKEYPIWDQFCTTTLKSSKRRYGQSNW